MPKKKFKDPHADREAEKYKNPIPSRELILTVLGKQKGPVGFLNLFNLLQLQDSEHKRALKRRLKAMVREGQLIVNRRREFGVVNEMDLIKGRVVAKRSGDGVVVPLEVGKEVLLLSHREMNRLYHNDIVLVAIAGIDKSGKKEAAVVEVLQRETQFIVGTLSKKNGIAAVTPFNRNFSDQVLITDGNLKKANDGDTVKVEITAFATRYEKAEGKIIDIIGKSIAPGKEVEVAIHTHELPHVWPDAVIKAESKLKDSVAAKAKKDRADLRQLPLVTIDGEDARDFDDAIYCEPKARGGWHLYVAIADVSYYVTPGSALDEEAYNRGNSVYFPDQVIPMLPEKLSNGLCSLMPNVDRLALVCEMSISAAGELAKYEFYEAVINSHARLTYTEVGEFLEGKSENFVNKYSALEKHIHDLHELFKMLLKQRNQRGAIEFELEETKIIFGKNRRIEQVVPVKRNDAHRIVEECMLSANVAAAKMLKRYKLDALYRVHGEPDEEKILELRTFLAELGLKISGKKVPEPQDYNSLLKKAAGRPDFHLIQKVLLRTLSQAVYSPQNVGHFGLSYDAYCHFTSPIRRYPDLITHRLLKLLIELPPQEAKLRKKISLGQPYDNPTKMLQLGEHCSMTERRADDATRDAISWLKCQYMEDKLGEEFHGVISGVTNFGFFVELANIYVDGLVHVTSLANDYYHFDPVRHQLVGRSTNITYRLGDSVRVKLSKVDVLQRRIDFSLIDKNNKSDKDNKTSKISKSSKDSNSSRRGKRNKKKQKKSV